MGYVASVETNVGDRLNLLHSGGAFGGTALEAFLIPLYAYCSAGEIPELREWISQLDARSNASVCQLVRLLLRSYYAGELSYDEDAYSWFLEQVPQKSFTEERLRRTIQQLSEKWVDARALRTSVNQLLTLFEESNPEATWWYDPQWTVLDLQTLSRTLDLAIERGAEQARIRFT